MRVAVDVLGPMEEPRMLVHDDQFLVMLLRPCSIAGGLHPSELTNINYDAGEMILCHRRVEHWIRTDGVALLSLGISDPMLTAASNGVHGVELSYQPKLVDPRLRALVTAVNAERIAGFPSGPLFLDAVEQALAVALVDNYAVRRPSAPTYRGGLGPARLRKVKELVHAKMEDGLTIQEMAQAVDLSTGHFCHMFRKSTGQSPRQFVRRRQVERAKEMLRNAEARVLDVAVACGFKTQQHFARVFRQVCGTSPSEYRYEFLP
jgi:AraC family transcriptional regulator